MTNFRFDEETPTSVLIYKVFDDDSSGHRIAELRLCSGGWHLKPLTYWMYNGEELVEISEKISSLNKELHNLANI